MCHLETFFRIVSFYSEHPLSEVLEVHLMPFSYTSLLFVVNVINTLKNDSLSLSLSLPLPLPVATERGDSRVGGQPTSTQGHHPPQGHGVHPTHAGDGAGFRGGACCRATTEGTAPRTTQPTSDLLCLTPFSLPLPPPPLFRSYFPPPPPRLVLLGVWMFVARNQFLAQFATLHSSPYTYQQPTPWKPHPLFRSQFSCTHLPVVVVVTNMTNENENTIRHWNDGWTWTLCKPVFRSNFQVKLVKTGFCYVLQTLIPTTSCDDSHTSTLFPRRLINISTVCDSRLHFYNFYDVSMETNKHFY